MRHNTQSVASRQKCSGEVYYSTTAFSTYHGLLAQNGRPDERTHFPFPGHCNRGCEHREPFLCVNVVTTDFRYIYFALKLRNKIIITYFPFQCNATYVFKQTKLQNIPASKSNKKKKNNALRAPTKTRTIDWIFTCQLRAVDTSHCKTLAHAKWTFLPSSFQV